MTEYSTYTLDATAARMFGPVRFRDLTPAAQRLVLNRLAPVALVPTGRVYDIGGGWIIPEIAPVVESTPSTGTLCLATSPETSTTP